MDNSIYSDIKTRTNGDIYIGVVGPVRTGKSTFIKKFMDLLVLPNITDDFERERTRDELPQSAAGRTIMTTEPKFIPNEAVTITLGDNANLRVKMIDCVGYIVKSAQGHIENDAPRMVNTPWFNEEIPFEKAAEIGTKKVIDEHSSIGILLTTDGSITDIPRNDYLEAEERVVKEMKAINKPFVIVLNTTNPLSKDAAVLKAELTEKYQVPVIPCDCSRLSAEDINGIMEAVLFEFPISEIGINIPKWIDALDDNHWLKEQMYNSVKESIKDIVRIREFSPAINKMLDKEFVNRVSVDNIMLGSGQIACSINVQENLFYKILSETTGFEIEGEDKLVGLLKELADIKKKYDKVAYALMEVEQKGYGIVSPTIDELVLEEPEMVKQGSRYGVRLRASAPSVHMIRADIETEVSPIVGSEKQSEELVRYLLDEFANDPIKLWQSNIFGKSLHELVNEGLHNKLSKMPDDAQIKLQETLSRIINEGSGGLICIIL